MYKIGQYKASDLMSDLICKNYPMLLVMSRFGIALGFGEDTIDAACRKNNVDTSTFLSVVNLLIGEEMDYRAEKLPDISIPSLVEYLRNSHSYFLDFRLPSIKHSLINALSDIENDANSIILKYFDEYYEEVKRHMNYEESNVFPYVEALLSARGVCPDYKIDIFSKQHDHVEEKLSELKNIIIKYYSANNNKLNCVLFDIFSCSEDLASHNKVEDMLFVPTITQIEIQKKK